MRNPFILRMLSPAAMLLGISLAVAGSGCADAKVESSEVSVLEFIPDAQRAGIAAGTSRYDATAAIHAARDKVQGTGKTLLLPPGNYYVGEVKFSGMVLPTMNKLEYIVELKRVIRRKFTLGTGDGWLKADGETIYRASDLKVGLFKGDTQPAVG